MNGKKLCALEEQREQLNALKKTTIFVPIDARITIKKIGQTDGYDSHSFRSYFYWPEKFTHLQNTVADINSIKKTNEIIRNKSKTVTFALTFAGTWHTLVKKSGFSKEEAKRIESNYQKLYQVSMDWVQEKLKQASKDGYVTLAFGVRLRTPILKQIIWNTSQMPYEASAEARSAGNAVSGQSYGALTMRATNEFRKRIRNSPWLYDIKLCGIIHDAIYGICIDNVDAIKWFNDHLIECMEWQELPEIQHDKVRLNAAVDVFYDGWHQPITIPNKASIEVIRAVCNEGKNKYEKI